MTCEPFGIDEGCNHEEKRVKLMDRALHICKSGLYSPLGRVVDRSPGSKTSRREELRI